MSHQEALDTLRLIRTEQVGPVTFHNLVSFYGSPAQALVALPDMARKGGRKHPLIAYPTDKAERELEAIAASGAKLVLQSSDHYPPLMRHIADAPPILIARGRTELMASDALIGMVGARNGSANACAFARKLAADLAAMQQVVVSGLARGIDTAAHLGSIAGGTIAVIAGGIDHIYPPENAPLFARIADEGCIVTEAPFGTAPMARHFPARNRIIAGMSRGVVVIEASLKSGSLITATDALDYGRDVFAVPGSPMDPRCHGSNDLIRNGAVLTESVADIMRALHPPTIAHLREEDPLAFVGARPALLPEQETEKAREAVMEKLGAEPVLLDELLLQCHMSAGAMYLALLELELAGRLVRHTGGTISLKMEDA